MGKKGAFIFQRSQNVTSIETIKTINSSLHYHDCYQCFICWVFTFLIEVWVSRNQKNWTQRVNHMAKKEHKFKKLDWGDDVSAITHYDIRIN